MTSRSGWQQRGSGELLVVVGYLDGAADAVPVLGTPAGAPQNAAGLLYGGTVVGRYAKHHLPNYGVFDEFRYFVPGASLTVARVHGVDVATVICEDIWQEGGPVAVTREADAGLLAGHQRVALRAQQGRRPPRPGPPPGGRRRLHARLRQHGRRPGRARLRRRLDRRRPRRHRSRPRAAVRGGLPGRRPRPAGRDRGRRRRGELRAERRPQRHRHRARDAHRASRSRPTSRSSRAWPHDSTTRPRSTAPW